MSMLDDILKALGTSRMQVRWRWRRFRERFDRTSRAAENRSRALRYQQKLCRDCQHPASVDEKRCSVCAGPLSSAHARNLTRVFSWLLPTGVPLTPMLVLSATGALYVITVKVTFDYLMGDMQGSFSPIWLVVLRFGGADSVAILQDGQWWRLVTANFLHMSVLHFSMNAIGCWLVGRVVEELFGFERTLFVFLLTGVVGFLASSLWPLREHALAAGASGSVFGWIGAIAAHGYRYRGHIASRIKGLVFGWAIFGVVVAVFVPHTDNVAHVAGLLCGLGLGFFLGKDRQAGRWPKGWWQLIAGACVVVVGYSFWQAAGHPPPEFAGPR